MVSLKRSPAFIPTFPTSISHSLPMAPASQSNLDERLPWSLHDHSKMGRCPTWGHDPIFYWSWRLQVITGHIPDLRLNGAWETVPCSTCRASCAPGTSSLPPAAAAEKTWGSRASEPQSTGWVVPSHPVPYFLFVLV